MTKLIENALIGRINSSFNNPYRWLVLRNSIHKIYKYVVSYDAEETNEQRWVQNVVGMFNLFLYNIYY